MKNNKNNFQNHLINKTNEMAKKSIENREFKPPTVKLQIPTFKEIGC